MYTHFIHTFRGGSMILLTNNAGDIKLAEVFSNKKVKEWVLIFYIVGVSVLVLKESIKI